jgi:hypothetical protein
MTTTGGGTDATMVRCTGYLYLNIIGMMWTKVIIEVAIPEFSSRSLKVIQLS